MSLEGLNNLINTLFYFSVQRCQVKGKDGAGTENVQNVSNVNFPVKLAFFSINSKTA